VNGLIHCQIQRLFIEMLIDDLSVLCSLLIDFRFLFIFFFRNKFLQNSLLLETVYTRTVDLKRFWTRSSSGKFLVIYATGIFL